MAGMPLDLLSGQRPWWRCDPRTTALYMIVVNLIVLSLPYRAITLFGWVFTLGMLLTILPRRWRFTVGYTIFFVLCAGLHFGVAPAINNGIVTLICAFLFYLAKYSVVLATGVYFVSTATASECVAAMTRLHVPDLFLVPLAVMFRFFPAVVEEARAIMDAMRLRGVIRGMRDLVVHPVKAVRYVVVPLLHAVIAIGEDLSASAMVRGLGSPQKKTSIVPLGLRWWDGVVLLLIVAFITLAVLTKLQVIVL